MSLNNKKWSENEAKVYNKKGKTCPSCKVTYTDYPALSRRGLGDICSGCGTREAIEDFVGREKELDETIKEKALDLSLFQYDTMELLAAIDIIGKIDSSDATYRLRREIMDAANRREDRYE